MEVLKVNTLYIPGQTWMECRARDSYSWPAGHGQVGNDASKEAMCADVVSSCLLAGILCCCLVEEIPFEVALHQKKTQPASKEDQSASTATRIETRLTG